MIEGTPRCVVIANAKYAALPILNRAVPDAEELERILETGHRYEAEVLQSLERGKLFDTIDGKLGQDSLLDGTLIVVWIGHGTIGPDNTLRLLGYAGERDVEVATAGQLAEWATRTGARQVLVVLDTCFSGGGVVDAARLAEAVNSGRRAPEKKWFGVIAASLRDDPARSGALVRELAHLLSNGPRQPDFRWDKKRPYIRGDDLLQALLADWNEPRQQPHPISVGRAWDLVRNPRFEPGVPDQPVEQLLLAARGDSSDASYFTGRERPLGEIVKWLRRGVPGLFVLTGPPGCGKSAVAARIVGLSSSDERLRLLASAPIPPDLDPGADCVDGQLRARGVTMDSASEELARQLGIDPSAGHFGLLAEARRRRKAGDPLVVVVDGLDEARAFSRDIAAEVLAPLARDALVLVSTRDVRCGDKTLIAQLGPAAQILDLGHDIEGTRQDIHDYVKRRLVDVAPTMDPERVAEELSAGGGTQGPQFLLARLVTSQLRDHPVDTSSEGWRLALATTAESALERDLQSVVLQIDGQPHPTAAREMIRALALAHGGGFPADDVWPAVATAISPTGTGYTRDDAYSVLAAFGRHIIAGSEGDQPVYRIAHQRLVDYVSGNTLAAAAGERPLKLTVAVGDAILAEYERLLDAGLGPRAHTYLWRHAWRHLAEAGASGLAGLRRLVERDPAFLPDLATGLQWATSEALSSGETHRALELVQEAVELRRELADGLKLAMALFSQAFIQAAIGDISGADASAAEAIHVARAAGDRPESRDVLGAVLSARAQTHLQSGQYKAALLLANEAIALSQDWGGQAPGRHDPGRDVDQGACLRQVIAHTLAGKAAFALKDVEMAAAMCERAVEIADRGGKEAADLRNEALAALADIQLAQAVGAPLDPAGGYGRVVATAAERLLDEYRRMGRRGTISDLPISQGIGAYVRARLIDLNRNFDVPDARQLPSLLREAIELVQPFADQLLDATVVLASHLSLSPVLPSPTDPARTAADFAQAERCLRQFAGTSDAVAVTLGRLLDAQTAVQLPQVLQGAAADLPGILVRQREAVTLLRGCPFWFARYPLAQALVRLSVLAAQPGVTGKDEEIAIRDEAIQAWRGLIGEAPDAPAQLAGLLSDQAARLLRDRTQEAADLALEAVQLAGELPQPRYAGLAGLAETNLAGAQLVLGRSPDTGELLRRAIEHLKPLVPHPFFSAALANARLNLALVELQDSHFAEALRLAEDALALFDSPAISPTMTENRKLALLARGRAERGCGHEDLGTATLQKAIGELRGAVLENEDNGALLAHAINTAAPDLWDEVLAGFADRPDLRRTLSLLRWRSTDETPVTVNNLVDALDASPEREHRALRQMARQQRSRAPQEFDAAWRKKTGTIPGWLELNPAHEWLVIAWWNTPNWRLSRDYLASHPALLGAETEIVLEELELDGSRQNLLDLHRQLLKETREVGATAAYAPLLADLDVREWLASKDLEQHLAEHGELLRPEIAALLRERAGAGDASSAILVSILDLVQRGESELAFQADKEPSKILEHLQAAWRSKDIARLACLATILQGCAEDAQVKRTATMALAIARTLERVAEEPARLLAAALEGSSEVDRQKLSAMVGDAIQHHPDRAADLAWLIQEIPA